MDIIKPLRLLLAGLAAGDSIGSTSEFMPQHNVRSLLNPLKTDPHAWPLSQVGGGSFNWEPGAPTDDTDMAMPIIHAVAKGLTGADFVHDVATGFVDWYRGMPRDIGGTTAAMLRQIKLKLEDGLTGESLWVPALDASFRNRKAWSNGALMRNGVAAAFDPEEEGALVRVIDTTMRHTMLTHCCALPMLCNLTQTVMIARSLDNQNNALQTDAAKVAALWLTDHDSPALDRYKSCFSSANDFHYEVGGSLALIDRALKEVASGQFNPFDESDNKYRNQGFCLLTLQIAYWVLLASCHQRNAEQHLPEWVPAEVRRLSGAERLAWVGLIGHDADTYGAAAGPLVAAYHGSVPDFLTNNLKALDLFDRKYAAGNVSDESSG